MAILVTGSSGHLGEALMRTLREAGRDAIGLDIKPSPFTDVVGSVCDRETVRRCLAGAGEVLHTATLHKPHVATHANQDFVDTNISGTLVLLEEAVRAGVRGFVFTSTTSAFGAALRAQAGGAAAWVTENDPPAPRNIYGTTKLAAEGLCELFFRTRALPVIVLRTARFFPEEDDDAAIRQRYQAANAQANEMLYRRADIADIVGAHLAALARAGTIGFGRYIVSATTPFSEEDLGALGRDAPAVVHRLYQQCASLYAAQGWTLFPAIDRVYVNRLARDELGWKPEYDFAHVLACLQSGCDFRSPLAIAVGCKGYHDVTFADGPYPVS
jgi:UDP-glucose 4-epimerase